MSKILFLAQFAPENGILLQQPQTPEEKFYAETYHLKVFESLQRLGYDFFSTSDVNHLRKCHDQYELVWSVYNRHGFRNCESYVQLLCEKYKVKYIGASPNIRTRIEDKEASKVFAKHAGLKTAKWVTVSKQNLPSEVAPFQGAYFVKPQFGSASIGIDESSICETWEQVSKKVLDYFSQGIEDIIVEQFIDGILYGIPIMITADQSLLVSVPHYTISNKKGNVVTYSQKRFVEGGMIREISLDKTLNSELMNKAESYYKVMKPCDYARVDFIVEKNTGIPYFLEVNALMNLGVHSGFVASFLHSHNMEYDDVIRHIVDTGLSKI